MGDFTSIKDAYWTAFSSDGFEEGKEQEERSQPNFTGAVPLGYYDEESKPKRRKITRSKAIEMLREHGLDYTVDELAADGWPENEISAISEVIMNEFAHSADGMATYGQMDTDDWAR